VIDESPNVAKPLGTVAGVQFVGVLKSFDAGFVSQVCARAAGAATSIADPSSAAHQ